MWQWQLKAALAECHLPDEFETVLPPKHMFWVDERLRSPYNNIAYYRNGWKSRHSVPERRVQVQRRHISSRPELSPI